jgi:hypothetical protein
MPRKTESKAIGLDSLLLKKEKDSLVTRYRDDFYSTKMEMLDSITEHAVRIIINVKRYTIIKKELNTKENYKKAADFLRMVADDLEQGKTRCYKNRMGRLKQQHVFPLIKKDGDDKKIRNNIAVGLTYLRP